MRWISVDPGKKGCGVAYWCSDALVCGRFVAVEDPSLDGPARWYALAEVVLSVPDKLRVTIQKEVLSSPGQWVNTAIVETMKVYVLGRADPADLLDLQGVAASVAAVAAERGARPVGVLASTWKKQVPRNIMGARIEAEVARRGWSDRIESPSRATHRNDVLHAIGLGLYALQAGLVKP